MGANVFQVAANVTGYKNREPRNAANVSNSGSYGGAVSLNATKRSTGAGGPGGYVPLAPPNLKLKGPGGLPVLDIVHGNWSKTSKEKTPYDGSGNVYDGGLNPPVFKKQAENPD